MDEVSLTLQVIVFTRCFMEINITILSDRFAALKKTKLFSFI